MKEGIILAAGIGSRLNGLEGEEVIKPLAEVDDLSLLVHTIRSLEIAACHQVIIVLGYKAEEIQKQILARYEGPVKLKFAINDRYHLQNGISVLSACSLVSGEFFLTMADHILDDRIMHQIRDHHPPPGGATLCVDYKLETIFDIDDATKVMAESSRIKKIGKDLLDYNCIDTGVFIGTAGLMEAIDTIYQQNGDASLSEGVQLLSDRGLMEVIDIEDAYWQDVDNVDMLQHAERLLREKSRSIYVQPPN